MSRTTARSQGVSTAYAAAVRATSLGLGRGTPIYDDMEAYARGSTNSPAVVAFLEGWTQELHARGYRSGVYSTPTSGIADLLQRAGTSYTEPDDIWFGDWNGSATASDPSIPRLAWSFNQRLHQYLGPHNATYGGVTINIDTDYCDAMVAIG